MELVKLWYKYLNRFINSDELLEALQYLDLNKYTIDTKSEIKRLIKDIKKIKEEIPNEFNEVEEKRLENINFFLDKLNEIDKNNCDEEAWNIISKKIKKLKKEKLLVRDSGALYNTILEKLNNCYSIFKYLHTSFAKPSFSSIKGTSYKHSTVLFCITLSFFTLQNKANFSLTSSGISI